MNSTKVKLAVLAGVIFCTPAFAEDGLVVHFTVKKSEANQVNTYTNGVLMRLTEASDMTFPGQYEMRLESHALSKDEVNLVVTLKDLSSGKPVYAGSGAATLKVGSSVTVPFHQLQSAQAHYEVLLDTSYGQLPKSAR